MLHLRKTLLLAALFSAAAAFGCASNAPGPYYRGGHGPYSDPYGRYDPYYSAPGYIVVDPHGERLERHQEREKDALERVQDDQKDDLQRGQKIERKELKQAGEWDKQDAQIQKDERKDQKRAFEAQDKTLRQHQREEWDDYRDDHRW
jgi:hypothetical protein